MNVVLYALETFRELWIMEACIAVKVYIYLDMVGSALEMIILPLLLGGGRFSLSS